MGCHVLPSPGDLPDLGIELRSPALCVDSLLSGPPGNAQAMLSILIIPGKDDSL